MKKALQISLAAIAAGVLFLSSCASSGKARKGAEVQAFDDAVRAGDLYAAVDALRSVKPVKNDAIKQRMDVALMQHFAGDYDASISGLTDVNMAMMDAVTKSVTRGALAAVANENASEYAGTVYENHYVNVFNALNYYNKGDLENAIAQVRDLTRKQQTFDMITDAAIADAEADEDPSGGEEKGGTGLDTAALLFNLDLANVRSKLPEKAGPDDQFRFSPTERYVAVMLYAVQSADRRTPRDIRNMALDEVERQSRLMAAVSGYDIAADTTVEPGAGRLNVLAFSDLIGRREEQDLYYPGDFAAVVVDTVLDVPVGIESARNVDPRTIYLDVGMINGIHVPPFNIKIAYPRFDAGQAGREKAVSRVDILVTGVDTDFSTRETLSLLEDFNEAVARDVKIKARKDYKRSMARSIIQKAAAVTSSTAGLSALQNGLDIPDFLTRQVAKAIGLAFTKIDEQVITADVRQVITLPGTARAGGITLAPGTYDVTVAYYDGAEVVDTQSFSGVQVQDGGVSFMESSCIRRR